MVNILISIFMVALLVICGLMTVVILMQKPSANAGMGAALGGGAAESVFGGEAGNMLLKYTIRIAVAFFAVSFIMYMAILANHRISSTVGKGFIPDIKADAATATLPATSAKTTASGAAGSAGGMLNPTLPGDVKSSTGAAPAGASATPAPAK